MSELRQSAGSEAFALVVRRVTAAEVARALGKSPGAVHNWSTGRRSPSAGVRRAIGKRYAVVAALWDAPPGAPAAAAHATPRAGGAGEVGTPAAAPVGEQDAQRVCLDTVRRLRQELERGDLTSRERASVTSALTSATRLLARLSGSLDLTPSQILRSASWRVVATTLVDALRAIPGASEAAAKALRALEGRDT